MLDFYNHDIVPWSRAYRDQLITFHDSVSAEFPADSGGKGRWFFLDHSTGNIDHSSIEELYFKHNARGYITAGRTEIFSFQDYATGFINDMQCNRLLIKDQANVILKAIIMRDNATFSGCSCSTIWGGYYRYINIRDCARIHVYGSNLCFSTTPDGQPIIQGMLLDGRPISDVIPPGGTDINPNVRGWGEATITLHNFQPAMLAPDSLRVKREA